MKRPFCLALRVVGLAVALYAVASLTGGWLGEPPWWSKAVLVEGLPAPIHVLQPSGEMVWMQPRPKHWLVPGVAAREGREWISGAVVLGGLGLAAFGAWLRQRPTPTSSGPRRRRGRAQDGLRRVEGLGTPDEPRG